VAVETGGKEPTQKTLAALIANARAENAKVIFVQPQFSKTAAASIAKAIGGTVAEFDDLAADWLDNLNRMGAALKSAVRH
jgi:zinc transport system substrate-binding protein